MSNFNSVCRTGCIADVIRPNPPEDEICKYCGAFLDSDGSCEKCGGVDGDETDPGEDR